MCRAPVGECDLPEFCWGDSQYCPEDVYLQDGVECYNGQVSEKSAGECQKQNQQNDLCAQQKLTDTDDVNNSS